MCKVEHQCIICHYTLAAFYILIYTLRTSYIEVVSEDTGKTEILMFRSLELSPVYHSDHSALQVSRPPCKLVTDKAPNEKANASGR